MAAANSSSKWADLLKPPAPKAVATSTNSDGNIQDSPVASIDLTKFAAYAKFIASDHADALRNPTELELHKIRDVALYHASEPLLGVKNALVDEKHAYIYYETRFALYLPTIEEQDVQQGWEIRGDHKKESFEGAYVVFSSDFQKVMEVFPREKGEKKLRNAAHINSVAQEVANPTQKKPLMERAKQAIRDWNNRAQRNANKKAIAFSPEATHLLSSALESTYQLLSVGLVTPNDTCILSHDLSHAITCFSNHICLQNWTEKSATQGKKPFPKTNKFNDNGRKSNRHSEK